MGEYIHHPELIDEIKIGVFRGIKGGERVMETFYPQWILRKMMESGYSNRSTIQNFLNGSHRIENHDSKQWTKSPLLRLRIQGDVSSSIEFLREVINEGYVVMLKEEDETFYLTTEYGAEQIQQTAQEANVNLRLKPYQMNV